MEEENSSAKRHTQRPHPWKPRLVLICGLDWRQISPRERAGSEKVDGWMDALMLLFAVLFERYNTPPVMTNKAHWMWYQWSQSDWFLLTPIGDRSLCLCSSLKPFIICWLHYSWYCIICHAVKGVGGHPASQQRKVHGVKDTCCHPHHPWVLLSRVSTAVRTHSGKSHVTSPHKSTSSKVNNPIA